MPGSFASRLLLALCFVGLCVAGGCRPAPVTARRGPSPSGPSPLDAGFADPLSDGASVELLGVPADAEIEVVVAAGTGPEAVGTGTDAAAMDAAIDTRWDGRLDGAVEASSQGPVPRVPRAGELVVDEILANPRGSDLGREWIEVVNRGPELLDLSALHLADEATDVAVPGGTLAPGGLIVLGQSTDLAKNGGAPVGASYGTRLILNNDAERVSLCLGPCAGGVVLDQVSWAGLGAAYDGHALVIDPVTKGSCAASAPFGTAGDCGTPGRVNPVCDETDAGLDSGADSAVLPDDSPG